MKERHVPTEKNDQQEASILQNSATPDPPTDADPPDGSVQQSSNVPGPLPHSGRQMRRKQHEGQGS